jgi:HEAT repeat protein
MLRALVPLLCAAALFPDLGSAADLPSDGELLAAARSADVIYQRHLGLLASRLERGETQEIRLAAIASLGRLQDAQAVVPLMAFAENPDRPVIELVAVATALGTAGNQAGLPALRRLTVHSNAEVRFAAYNALGQLGAATGSDHLQRAKDNDEVQHLAGLTNAGTVKQTDAAPLLIAGLATHPRALVRRQCAIGLGRLGDVSNAPALQDALSDPDAGVRRYAAEALAALNYRPAIPFMLFALDSNIASDEISRAVTKLSGQDFGFNSRDNLIRRQAAIERGFQWWTAHAQDR